MDTIRNYLESMFANLPNTPEVLKARSELGQMMEDKYSELISEGRTENEAISVVIAEFGNLDEIAETLGIDTVVRHQQVYNGRTLTSDEIRGYVMAREKASLLRSIGVLLCIISPVAFIIAAAIAEGAGISEKVPIAISTGIFFAMIAAAVGIFVYTSFRMGEWSFLKEQPCSIDYSSAGYIESLRESDRTGKAVLMTIGIILCVVCFVPVSVIGALGLRSDVGMYIGSAVLFILVGIGVMLLINAGAKESACLDLLKLNGSDTVGGNYVEGQHEDVYTSETVTRIMEVFNPTVLCIYLCWSFLTFDWHITWIIWPIAAIARHWMRAIWGVKGEQTS